MRSILCLFLLIFALPAQAQMQPAAPVYAEISKANFSELQPDLTAVKIQKVIDPLTLLSTDGKIYKLSGIDIPEAGETAIKAMKELEALLTNQDVKLYLTKDASKGRQTRLGQMLVQMERRKDNLWIAGQLLADGLARVRTTPANPEMARQMLALEAAAREKKTGLWAEAEFAVLTPEQAEGKKNSFQIVEGEVYSVAQKNNETFLNFASDWKKDFTISITPELRRDLSRRNINFLSLAHKKVRVRGWVEDRNGPMISLDHGQQLELLDKSLPSLQEPVAGMGHSISAPEAPKVDTPEIDKPEIKKLQMAKPEAEQEAIDKEEQDPVGMIKKMLKTNE